MATYVRVPTGNQQMVPARQPSLVLLQPIPPVVVPTVTTQAVTDIA